MKGWHEEKDRIHQEFEDLHDMRVASLTDAMQAKQVSQWGRKRQGG